MKRILLFVLLLLVILATASWIRFGGGSPYPDVSTTPTLAASLLEEVLAYSEPIGDVAVSEDGRLFFSVHPDSRSPGNRVLEFVDGASVPYPDLQRQLELFDTVQGIAIDGRNRLWAVDHGNHGFRKPAVVAIDLASGEILRQQSFGADIAPIGSFLQDIAISTDGNTAVISDASLWRMEPALIVYDVRTGVSRRVLDDHLSVETEDYVIRSNGAAMSYVGGIFSLRAGVDGLSIDDEWLYYGALTGGSLYRVRLADLLDEALPAQQLATRVERHATKPLGGSMSVDAAGNIYMTDVEHSAIVVASAPGDSKTLIRSDSIRWPEGLAFGPDGWLYVSDSALPDLILKSREHITAQRPFRIYRVQPQPGATAGRRPTS